MSRRPRVVTFVLPAALVALALSASGCESPSKEDADVRASVTPELRTLSERSIEVDNTMLLTLDTNARSINNDLRRIWLLDRPVRLTREPMPR